MKYIILFLMIGGSLQAAPIVIKGFVTNNNVSAGQGTFVRIQYTQLGDTIAVTDTLGYYEVTINPRFNRGTVTASYIDTCNQDTITLTKPYDSSITPTVTINLNGCVPQNPSGFVIKGKVINLPNPYKTLFINYSLGQFKIKDSVVVDSFGNYFKTISDNSAGQIEYQLIDCNNNIIKDSANYSLGDTVTTNFDYCVPPTYFGWVTLNGFLVLSNDVFLLLYEYNITEQSMVFKDTVRVNSGGRFSFPKNETSDYLLKALPTTSQQQFSATYYPSGFSWAKNSLAIGPHISDTTALIIELNKKQPSQTGKGVIAGELRIDDNLKTPGFNGKGIHLLNENETPIDYKYADASGNFIFENVAPGDYFVWFDQCGISTEPIPVTLSSNDESADGLIITANRLGISYDNFVSIASKTEDSQNIIAYPNPFTNQLELSASSNSEVVVFNLHGQPITHFKMQENETRTIDTELWPAGFYVINVRSKNNNYSIKLLKD